MSVSAISGIMSETYQSQLKAITEQRRSQFQQLGQDLQSGDLSAAQQDFASLMQTAAKPAAQDASSTSIGQEFNQLGQDLQSGDLTDAQKLFDQIQQQLQNFRPAHGRHHHHPAVNANDPTTGDAVSQPGATQSTAATADASATSAIANYGSAGLMGLLSNVSALSALV